MKKRYTPPEPSPDTSPLTAEERKDALCIQVDTEIFFAELGAGYSEAEKICKGCPIAARCLSAAIEQDERYGFFAASPQERDRIKERREQERTTGMTLAEFWARGAA